MDSPMTTTDKAPADLLEERYRAAADAGAVADFVAEVKGLAAFEAWLNSDAIPCDAFFACAVAARAAGALPALLEERAAALAWFDGATRVQSTTRPRAGDFTAVVKAVDGIDAPLR